MLRGENSYTHQLLWSMYIHVRTYKENICLSLVPLLMFLALVPADAEFQTLKLNLKRDLGDIVPRGENSSTHHMLWSMTRSNNKEKGGVDAVKNGLWVDLLLGRHKRLLCCCLAFSYSKLFETGCLLVLKINSCFLSHSIWFLCLCDVWGVGRDERSCLTSENPRFCHVIKCIKGDRK